MRKVQPWRVGGKRPAADFPRGLIAATSGKPTPWRVRGTARDRCLASMVGDGADDATPTAATTSSAAAAATPVLRRNKWRRRRAARRFETSSVAHRGHRVRVRDGVPPTRLARRASSGSATTRASGVGQRRRTSLRSVVTWPTAPQLVHPGAGSRSRVARRRQGGGDARVLRRDVERVGSSSPHAFNPAGSIPAAGKSGGLNNEGLAWLRGGRFASARRWRRRALPTSRRISPRWWR